MRMHTHVRSSQPSDPRTQDEIEAPGVLYVDQLQTERVGRGRRAAHPQQGGMEEELTPSILPKKNRRVRFAAQGCPVEMFGEAEGQHSGKKSNTTH